MGWQDRPYNREDGEGGVPRVQFSLPPISPLSLGIMIACFVLFVAQQFPWHVTDWLSLTFINNLGWKQPWRFVTYQYLHGGGAHLFFNMLGVYFFMPALEQHWGRWKALAFYTLGGIAAGLLFWIVDQFVGSIGLIGASGSVLAILGAVALLFPERQIILLFFPVAIRTAALLLGILFTLTAVADRDLSNAAHLGGLLFGFFAPWLAGPVISRQRHKWEQYRAHRELESELSEQREVDRILAKVAEKGMQSLTSGEKRALSRATANQKKRDQRRDRRKTFI